MSRKKKRKPKSLNPERVVKKGPKGQWLCWWPNCSHLAKRYGLCFEHYKIYKANLKNDLDLYSNNDIQCLNLNLSNDKLVFGQWNHGNNK